MEKKKQKKKVSVALVAMSMAFLGTAGALVGVLAASTQSISSTFSVSYSIGDNVAVAVGANSCRMTARDEKTWFTATGAMSSSPDYNDHLYTLWAPGGDYNLALQGGSLETNATNQLIVSFYFENLNDENSVSGKFIDGALTNPATHNMMTAYFGGVVDDINTFPLDIYGSEGYDGSFDPYFRLDKDNSYTFEIPPESIYCITIMFDPADVNKTSDYISNADGGLSFILGEIS